MKNCPYKNFNGTLFMLSFYAMVFFVSCGKKWKETTSVDFKFNITQSESSENLHFTSGNMIIREISFSGERKKGGSVNFTNSITNGAILNLDNGTSIPAIRYDIPQGTYSKINLTIKAFDEDPSPSLSLYGYYVEDNSDSVPFIYEFHSGVNFNVTGKTSNGSSEIVLIEGRPATCVITFAPNYWFDTVTDNLLNDAEESYVDGDSTILINENSNPVIYNLISSRIAEATKAVFQ